MIIKIVCIYYYLTCFYIFLDLVLLIYYVVSWVLLFVYSVKLTVVNWRALINMISTNFNESTWLIDYIGYCRCCPNIKRNHKVTFSWIYCNFSNLSFFDEFLLYVKVNYDKLKKIAINIPSVILTNNNINVINFTFPGVIGNGNNVSFMFHLYKHRLIRWLHYVLT